MTQCVKMIGKQKFPLCLLMIFYYIFQFSSLKTWLTHMYFIIVLHHLAVQVWDLQPDRWGIGPNPVWYSAWTMELYAWSLRAHSKQRRSNSSSTSRSTRPPQTTGRRGLVWNHSLSFDFRGCFFSALEFIFLGSLSVLCPADRCEPGQRQTGAEAELGWQRDKYWEGDLGWKIDSGKEFSSPYLKVSRLYDFLQNLFHLCLFICTWSACPSASEVIILCMNKL